MFMPFEDMRSAAQGRIDLLVRQGFDVPVEAWKKELAETPDSYDALIAFAKKLNGSKLREDYPYIEPDELDAIRAARPEGHRDTVDLFIGEKEIRDKIQGGVFGRMIGCILGKPLEGYECHMEDVRTYLEPLGAWPLSDYVPQFSPAQKRPLERDTVESMKDFVRYVQADDDINYLVMGLKVMETWGIDFNHQAMALTWLGHVACNGTFGPEHSRYVLFANAFNPFRRPWLPEGEAWTELTTFLNPDEDKIGAMIRGDAFGLMNPGRPAHAAELAWRDGYNTHKKTGLYAEMWVAATIAAAFHTFDPVEAINIGLEQLPANAYYTECVKKALDISLNEPNYEKAYDHIRELWDHYGFAGTINETGAIVNALVHSVDSRGLVDYEKAICQTVMQGWDTDCSGATAGCIAGVLAGYHNIPDKWLKPINNTFYSNIANEPDSRIDAFAERMYTMSRVLRRV
jgi:ADP-ribosylglycohydrolase